jgi:hypothetical protein
VTVRVATVAYGRGVARPLDGMRWIVFVGLGIGAALFVQRLVGGESVFRAFLVGSVASFVLMQLLAVGHRLWRGGRIVQADAPGGWRLRFVDSTRRSIRTTDEHALTQLGELSERLAALERDVTELKRYKDGANSG